MIRPFFRRVSPPRYFLSLSAGDGQSATVVTAVSTAPKVRVLNNAGAAVVGAQILWVPQNDATVNGGAVAVVATDASGYSTLTSHVLSPTAGANTLTATLAVTGAVVTFTQTGVADAAAVIQANAVVDQDGSTTTAVTAPPSVLVTDVYGNPISGQAITWAVASGGGSINTTGGTTTNSSGIATLTSWTLGASVGANTVTATVAGLSGSPVTFSANASAGTPTQIVVQSGGTQTGIVAGQAATAITFRVKDAGNTAVQGVTVSFRQSGTGSLSVASAVTNASGDASVTLTTGALIETNTITAEFAKADGTIVSASTTVASTFGAKSKLGFQTQPSTSGSSGTALSQQPIILVQDANGNTVTTATDTITATVGSGNASISAGATKAAVAGVATFSGFTVVDVDGGVNVFRFSSGALTACDSSGTTLAPPVPVALLMGTQPNNPATGTGSLACTVRVVDSNGTTVPGATDAVTVALTTPGGATLSGATTVNAVAGVATFSGLSVSLDGTYTLTCTSGTLTPVVSASFTASTQSSTHPDEPASMTQVTEADFQNAVQVSTTAQGIIAPGWYLTSAGSSNVSLVTDQTDMTRLTNSAYRIRYQTTLTGGTAPCNFGKVFSTAEKGTTLYWDFDWKVDPAWDGNGSGVNKMTFVCAGGIAAAPFYFSATGSGQNTLRLQVRIQAGPVNKGGNAADGSQNVPYDSASSAAVITRGQKFRVRGYATMNTVDGSGNANADGVLYCKIDENLIYNKTTMAYRGNDATARGGCGPTALWDQWKINPTFGGGPPSPTQLQYFWVGYVYLSTK